jgi:3-hydroxyisobutyrate dehydrogenase-like beta-hydroxyacid dehydrogenase
MQDIGIFGLGLIGTAISTRLLAAGYGLRGHDPQPARCDHLISLGGTAPGAEAIWGAEAVFAAVFDTDQLESLIETAPDGVTTRLISVSTCDPARMPGLAMKAAAKGIELIEAPISGTSADLAEGKVVFFVAGDPASAEAIAPLLAALSRKQFPVGAVGNGNRAKLAINLVLGLNRAALAEGLVFAQKLGLDPAVFLDLARNSAAASAVMEGKGKRMVARDFTPLGRIAQSAKDFTLIRDAAAEQDQELPFTETYLAMMQDALDHGEGDLDNAAVLLPIERAKAPK